MTARLRQALSFAVWLALHGTLAIAAVPELIVESPPELEGIAARLRTADAGVLAGPVELLAIDDPGPPIRVVLAAESSFLARSAPGWVSGYADGERGQIVLFPSRGLAYPDGSLEELIAHEVTHVLLARRVRGGDLPRWLNEGLAMAASGGWGLVDKSQLTLAMVRGGRVELRQLESWFSGPAPQVRRAYAFSGAFVHYLLRQGGREGIDRLLDGLAAGDSFDDAFRVAFGAELASVEASFWRRFSFFYRWLPFLTSSAVLWILISLLALVAFRRRRAIDAEIELRWQLNGLGDEPAVELPTTESDDELVN